MEWSTAGFPSISEAFRTAERSTPSWRSRYERRGAASSLCPQRPRGFIAQSRTASHRSAVASAQTSPMKGRGMKESAKHQLMAHDGDAAKGEGPVLPVLMTTTEVAELLRVDPSTLSKWRSCGQGPRATWLTPSTPRYARSDVLAWLGRAVG
jgi:Helix-turn-helix domain